MLFKTSSALIEFSISSEAGVAPLEYLFVDVVSVILTSISFQQNPFTVLIGDQFETVIVSVA